MNKDEFIKEIEKLNMFCEEKDNIKFYFSDKDIEDLRGDISRIKHDYFKMKNGKSIVD